MRVFGDERHTGLHYDLAVTETKPLSECSEHQGMRGTVPSIARGDRRSAHPAPRRVGLCDQRTLILFYCTSTFTADSAAKVS